MQPTKSYSTGRPPYRPGCSNCERHLRRLAAVSVLIASASAVHLPAGNDRDERVGNQARSSEEAVRQSLATHQRANGTQQTFTFVEGMGEDAQVVQNCGMKLQHRVAWMGPSIWTHHQKEALKSWQNLPSAVAVDAKIPAKLGIAMMIYTKIVFSKSWETFLTEPGTNFAMSIHVKGVPEIPYFFHQFLLHEKQPNAWCQNRHMMLWLMSTVLNRDKNVSHVVMVSGDTLPIKPLSHMTQDLRVNDHTHFCADLKWKRAETFFAMRRDHINFLQENVGHLNQLLTIVDAHRWADCIDEDTFYWPLLVRKAKVANSCPMMTDWSGTDKYWALNAKRCHCPDFLKSKKTTPDCGHPAMYKDISFQGLNELFSSPGGYWFARKFIGDGVKGVPTYNNGHAPLDPAVTMILLSMRKLKVTPLAVHDDTVDHTEGSEVSAAGEKTSEADYTDYTNDDKDSNDAASQYDYSK